MSAPVGVFVGKTVGVSVGDLVGALSAPTLPLRSPPIPVRTGSRVVALLVGTTQIGVAAECAARIRNVEDANLIADAIPREESQAEWPMLLVKVRVGSTRNGVVIHILAEINRDKLTCSRSRRCGVGSWRLGRIRSRSLGEGLGWGVWPESACVSTARSLKSTMVIIPVGHGTTPC